MANLISILVEAKDNASAQLRSIGGQVEQFDRKSQSASGATERFGGSLSRFGSILSTTAQAFIGYQLVDGVEKLVSGFVSASGELEQTNMSFQSLIGNTQQANALFGQLVQYANQTPFQAKDVESAAKQLLAFGGTAQQVTGWVKQLGDVTAAGGGDLQALALVTGQVFAQGKLRAQDMYQVINDGGAGLIKIMADNAGGMQKLTAEFETGGIPAKQYFDAINQATNNGGFAFQGANKQAQTLNGRISTLKDSASQFGEALLGVHTDPQLGLQIQPGGLFDRMKAGIQGTSAALSSWGPAIQRTMPGFLDSLGHLASVVADWLGPSLHALADTLETRLGPMLVRLGPWLEIGAKVVGGVLIGALWLLINTLNVVVSVASWLGQVIENTANWFVHAWRDVALPVWQGVVGFFQNLGNDIAGAVKSIESVLTAPFRNAYDAVLDLFRNLPHELEQIVVKSFNSQANVARGIFHALHIPGFANGTQYAPGGLAVVGENGPELVNLPRGSQVLPSRQTGALLSGGVGGGVTIQTLNVNNNVDANAVIRKIGFKLATA